MKNQNCLNVSESIKRKSSRSKIISNELHTYMLIEQNKTTELQTNYKSKKKKKIIRLCLSASR